MRSTRMKVLVAVAGMLIATSAVVVAAHVSPRRAVRAPYVRLGAARSYLAQTLAAPAVADPWRAQIASQQALEDRIDHDPRAGVWGSSVLRLWQDFALKSTDTVDDVTVVRGSATIDGFVDGSVVVCLGSARVSNTAIIRGSLIVIGGDATVASGAVIRRDLMVIGGVTDAEPGFLPGGEHIAFGATSLGDRLRDVLPWITRGLLLGRPIVPNLAWVWWIAGLFFVVHFLVNLVFHEPVRASAATLTGRPLSAFMTGLLVLLLTGPLLLLLVISVIGVLVVPFALCALAVAGLIGKAAAARAIGASVIRPESADSRPQAMRSFLIGSAVLLILYLVPVVGLMTWGIVSVFGLGCAVLAFLSALRRENPASPPVPKPKTEPLGFTEARPWPDEPPAPADSTSLPSDVPPPTSPPVHGASGVDLTAFPRAAFIDRLAAFALDLLLVFIVYQVVIRPYPDTANKFLSLVLAYYVGFWTWKGTTVGGIICNLRVIRVDGAPLRFVDAVVRGLSGVFSIAALGLGGLWILRDPDRQAWHDKISATYVVKVPRTWAVP